MAGAGSGQGSGSAAKTAPLPPPALVPPAPTAEDMALVPGMFAEARVTIGQAQHPVLPANALIKRGKTWHAFVLVKGELEERVVQLGATPEVGKVAVTKNIEVGDKVVSPANDKLVDGQKAVE